MASTTPEEKLVYLLTVLKHCELPKPNYRAVAEERGVNNANNAQKRFKAIVEAAGFSLVDNQIVDSSDDPEGKSRDKNVITSGPPRNAGNGSSKTKPKTDEKVNGSVKRKVSTATTVAATAPTNMNKEVAAKKRKFESTVVKQQSDDDGTDEQDENENGSAMRANNEI